MRSGGCFSLSHLTANGNGSIIVGDGQPAAISYTGHATLNGQLSRDNTLYVCQAPGATVNNPENWGSATVVANCTNGCNVLSHQEFEVVVENQGTHLQVRWSCSICTGERVYEVSALTEEGYVQLLGLTTENTYMISLQSLPAWRGYIQVVGLDQGLTVLRSVAAYEVHIQEKLMVYPTLIQDEVQVWYAGGAARVEIYDAYGRVVRQGEANAVWHLGDLPKGVYLIVGWVEGRSLPPVRVVRI